MFKVVFVVKLVDYMVFGGKYVDLDDIDLLVCVMFMGKFYYVMMGVVVVVIGMVVVILGILVSFVVVGGVCEVVWFGYLLGILWVGV